MLGCMHETISLRDDQGSCVEILPSRGALIARFFAGGEEVLFVDDEALAVPNANVHGGIPILFPIAGKLPQGSFEHEGKTYGIAQHGFARARAWEVVERSVDALRCEFEHDAATLAQFPWRFRARFSARIAKGKLDLALSASNMDSTPMPFHAGLHPYFSVPRAAKSAARVDTDATLAFDNISGMRGPIAGIDLTELDLHLEDHSAAGTLLHRGVGLRPIVLQWSGANRVVLWSRREADFICVEPWTAAGGALAGGDSRLPWIRPGNSAALTLSIRLG